MVPENKNQNSPDEDFEEDLDQEEEREEDLGEDDADLDEVDPDEADDAEEEPDPVPKNRVKPEVEPKLVKKELPIVQKASIKVRRAFVLDASGNKIKDAESQSGFREHDPGYVRFEEKRRDGKEHTVNLGYVNPNGVLFPAGFRFKGGHVASARPEHGVVLNQCPKCGYRQSVDEAVQGVCQNMKAGPEKIPCGYSAYDELDAYDLE